MVFHILGYCTVSLFVHQHISIFSSLSSSQQLKPIAQPFLYPLHFSFNFDNCSSTYVTADMSPHVLSCGSRTENMAVISYNVSRFYSRVCLSNMNNSPRLADVIDQTRIDWWCLML